MNTQMNNQQYKYYIRQLWFNYIMELRIEFESGWHPDYQELADLIRWESCNYENK